MKSKKSVKRLQKPHRNFIERHRFINYGLASIFRYQICQIETGLMFLDKLQFVKSNSVSSALLSEVLSGFEIQSYLHSTEILEKLKKSLLARRLSSILLGANHFSPNSNGLCFKFKESKNLTYSDRMSTTVEF